LELRARARLNMARPIATATPRRGDTLRRERCVKPTVMPPHLSSSALSPGQEATKNPFAETKCKMSLCDPARYCVLLKPFLNQGKQAKDARKEQLVLERPPAKTTMTTPSPV